jgi:DnaJ-class molecular chaperone
VRRFREVWEAYEVLSDRARREEYDAKIKSAS